MTEQHVHRCDTNGDRYRCPIPGCWWRPTGVQVLPDLDDVPGREPYCTAPGCGLPVTISCDGTWPMVATHAPPGGGHPVELAWRDREQVQA